MALKSGMVRFLSTDIGDSTGSPHTSSMRRPWITTLLFLLTAVAPAFSIGSSAAAAASAPVAITGPPWVKDSVQDLNIFLPDADSDYYLDGFGTAAGARTVISGEVPAARYWSFTAYPLTSERGTDVHVRDTQIRQTRGRYTVTLSSSCAHITGTCIATKPTGASGIVVMRLYVPADVNGAGTGGVPLPTISYERGSGQSLSLNDAADSSTASDDVNFLRLLHGQLPAALARPYPAAAPVPTPVENPKPVARPTGPKGEYANPDNLYDHMALSSRRGNLVVSGKAPTYRKDSQPSVNDLGRRSDAAAQVRYWSLCVVLVARATGDCLRDEQVHLSSRGTFTVVVSPTCPETGYENCLLAGAEPIQVGLAYRNLLPSKIFALQAFHGAYALTGTYVARTP
jgi:hypothetical protein